MVRARVRPEDHTAATPMRRVAVTLTSTAGPLLAPHLVRTAPDLAARLGIGRALALICKLRDDRLVHDRPVRLHAKHPIVQVERADDLALDILHVHRGHRSTPRFLIMISPPLGPGMAPRMAIRFRSASMRTISRFWTVTRSSPMWPAIFMPFMTRPGVVPEPIEPGARQRSDWPC